MAGSIRNLKVDCVFSEETRKSKFYAIWYDPFYRVNNSVRLNEYGVPNPDEFFTDAFDRHVNCYNRLVKRLQAPTEHATSWSEWVIKTHEFEAQVAAEQAVAIASEALTVPMFSETMTVSEAAVSTVVAGLMSFDTAELELDIAEHDAVAAPATSDTYSYKNIFSRVDATASVADVIMMLRTLKASIERHQSCERRALELYEKYGLSTREREMKKMGYDEADFLTIPAGTQVDVMEEMKQYTKAIHGGGPSVYFYDGKNYAVPMPVDSVVTTEFFSNSWMEEQPDKFDGPYIVPGIGAADTPVQAVEEAAAFYKRKADYIAAIMSLFEKDLDAFIETAKTSAYRAETDEKWLQAEISATVSMMPQPFSSFLAERFEDLQIYGEGFMICGQEDLFQLKPWYQSKIDRLRAEIVKEVRAVVEAVDDTQHGARWAA